MLYCIYCMLIWMYEYTRYSDCVYKLKSCACCFMLKIVLFQMYHYLHIIVDKT